MARARSSAWWAASTRTKVVGARSFSSGASTSASRTASTPQERSTVCANCSSVRRSSDVADAAGGGSRRKNPYEVLGVARDADEDAIRKAYRKLARKHHPDVNPGDK